MTVPPRGVRHEEELAQQINALKPYPFGVVNLRFKVDEDWTGEPSLFVRVTLSDEAAAEPGFYENTRNFSEYFDEKIEPIRKWDLFPFITFRSESEQEKLKDPNYGV